MKVHSMKKIVASLAVLPAIMLTLVFIASASAAQVQVAPASTEASVGDTVTVSIVVDQVTDLGGFQFGFTFAPSLLEVAGVRIVSSFETTVVSQFTNTAGNGMVAAAALAAPLSGEAVPLVAIDFTVKAPGAAAIGLTNVILGRIGGEEIPSTSLGGTINAGGDMPSTFTITSSTGTGGKISPLGETSVAYGGERTYDITPETGYHVEGVLVDDVSQGVVSSFTFTNVTSNRTISASFAADTHTITVSPGEHGTITVSGAPVSGVLTVNHGDNASFNIAPGAGYRVDDVSVDGVSKGRWESWTFENVTANHSISATFASDAVPAFSSVSPAQGSFINTTVVGYTLNRDITSGSVAFERTGGEFDTSHTYDFSETDMSEGPHSIDTGLTLVDGAVYTVAFSASDGVNPGSATVNNVTYDTTAALAVIGNPQSNTYANSAEVSYTLSEPVTTGTITIAWTGGASDPYAPHAYSLTGEDMTIGAHTVDAGAALAQGAIYAFSVGNVTDQAGNPTNEVSSINVTFDSQSVSITDTTPGRRAIAIGDTVGYTLSEEAQSGKVTFTRTGGAEDLLSPHEYYLSGEELAAGSHTVTPGFPLADGAFYTVSFEATDLAGNPAATVSNAMVFHDGNYGKGPVGNLDGNEVVDEADVQILKNSMGGRPGDPGWNPACDLDRNNVIDQKDLMILMQRYGR